MGDIKRVEKETLWKVLKNLILDNTNADGIFPGAFPELLFHYHETPEMPIKHFLRPILIIIAQCVGIVFAEVASSPRMTRSHWANLAGSMQDKAAIARLFSNGTR